MNKPTEQEHEEAYWDAMVEQMEDQASVRDAYHKVLEEIEYLREQVKDQKAEIEELTEMLNESRGFGSVPI